MYVHVYSPEGELFEVTRNRADKLILQDGWTQTKPETVEVSEEYYENDSFHFDEN